jgi:Secretion system C-terminal sorting domain
MKTMKTFLLFATALLSNLASFCQSGPELIFENPVLVGGTANVQGAVYRFSNVTTGVDAEIKLKKFSRNDIVMATVDNAALGWSKAFQPEFGLSGLVAANQNWYIDFELTFYKAGTNAKQLMDTVDLTALDVDGDGHSISEYVTYSNPSSIMYSAISFLTSTPIIVLGQVFECGQDAISSALVSCTNCGGDGIINSNGANHNECNQCDGSGMKHSACGHAYEGASGNTVSGPVNNFVNIDTSATQVMATYQFLNRDRIRFRYGAKTNNLTSNGAGIRLNSTWFREFSLAPMSTLPVKLTSFNAFLTSNNKVDLKWSTASEMNVSHFGIERSIDGSNFSDAGTVFAYGNTTVESDYMFADNISNVQSSVIYYRLRSVDVDGKTQYSEIRIIRNNKQVNNSIVIATYPNPVTNELRITIPANWQNKKAVYEIITLNGQVIKKNETANSSQTETVNVSNLASGIYFVRVNCEGQTAQQKIVKH